MVAPKKGRLVYNFRYAKRVVMFFHKKLNIFLILFFLIVSCENKVSENDLKEYKEIMDIRLGHLGNAIILQGRLMDAFNLRNDRADEDHFK